MLFTIGNPGYMLLARILEHRGLLRRVPETDVIDMAFLRKHFAEPYRKRLILDERFNAYRQAYPHARIKLMREDMRNAIFTDVDMHGADCWRAVLDGATILRSDFSDTTLVDASITRCRIVDTNLSDASLVRARFDGGQLERVALKKADMRETSCSSVRFIGTDVLEAATINGANFWRAELPFKQQRVIIAQLHASFVSPSHEVRTLIQA